MQRRRLSLFHQLDNVFIIQHVVLAHFLRVVFHGRSPHECTERGRVVKITQIIAHECKQDARFILHHLTWMKEFNMR